MTTGLVVGLLAAVAGWRSLAAVARRRLADRSVEAHTQALDLLGAVARRSAVSALGQSVAATSGARHQQLPLSRRPPTARDYRVRRVAAATLVACFLAAGTLGGEQLLSARSTPRPPEVGQTWGHVPHRSVVAVEV